MAYNNTYWKPKKQAFPRNLNRDEGVKEAIKIRGEENEKNRSFWKETGEEKRISIAISSAFNGSADICTALLRIGKLEPEQFWDEHEKWYEDYFNRFTEKQKQPTQKQLEPQEPSVSADEPLDINNL